MLERKRPFPTFVLWLLVFFVALLVLLLRGCGSLFTKEPPNITITAEDATVNYIMEKNTWNGAVYDHLDPFYCYGRDIVTPSQAAAGEAVSIRMAGDLPDQVTFTEYALEADDHSPYGSVQLLEEHDFYFSGVTGSFLLPEPGEHPVRGYLLSCSWGENTCEYAFVLQILPE